MKSLPWDDRKSKSVARMKRKALLDEIALIDVASGVKKMVLCDDHKDEDLNDAVDKFCKGILDYISPTCEAVPISMDFPKKPRLDVRGSSGFLEFSKQHKSKFYKFMKSYSRVGIYPKKDVLLEDDGKACPIAMLDDEDVLERYKNFKRFDTVVDHSDHLFSNSPLEQTTEAWAERMREEWRLLEENLPEAIFVRAYESRVDLLRAVIIGAKGTPYQDGLFFFDVFFPRMYPLEPPGFGSFLELSRGSASAKAAILDGKILNDGPNTGKTANPADVVNEADFDETGHNDVPYKGNKVTISDLLQTTLSSRDLPLPVRL